MDRRLIVIGVGVLLAVAIVLAIKIRSSDSSADSGVKSDPATPADPAPSVKRDHVATPDPIKVPEPGSDEDSYTETEINGVRVRDHRKDAQHPVDLPPNIHHPDGKKLPSTLVYDISAKLQAVMKECAQIPKEARGAKPKIEGTVFVDVKAGTLEVKEATVQIRDVEGDTSAIKQCMEQKSVGQKVPSGTEEDTEHYSISILYTIPEY